MTTTAPPTESSRVVRLASRVVNPTRAEAALATELRAADEELSAKATPEIIEDVVRLIPDQWLDAEEHRGIYTTWLQQRLEARREWVEEAIRAHALRV